MSKSQSTELGDTVLPGGAFVIAVASVVVCPAGSATGLAKGGFEESWDNEIGYRLVGQGAKAPRTDVLPFLNGSHEKPKRGCKFSS